VHDLHVSTDGDVGFCFFLYHVSGTLIAGGEVDMCIDGRWLIKHDHESVPYDPTSGQGS
jgi:ketosteroid isomerase-like protein